MNSMKARLFALLMLATGFVWICGMAWIYAGSRKELERVLDVRLEEATRMVSSLMENADMHVAGGVSGVRMANQTLPFRNIDTNFRLACQIWSIDGRLVGKSSEAPMTQLTNANDGYSNQDIDGARWRVYAHVDKQHGIRVLVGDNIAHRERLVRELMWGLAVPGLFVFGILSALIWLALRQGLEPLSRLSAALAGRSPQTIGPLDIGKSPSEIRPVVDALDGLFAKVAAAREHERSVTAFAAHELRTPLAGLRTQVQIALGAPDTATRDAALRSAIVAADRTNRMATQLLAMANVDTVDPRSPQEWVNAGTKLRAIARELGQAECDHPIVVEEALYRCQLRVNADAFHMAVRNLTENAFQHGGGHGGACWRLDRDNNAVRLVLEDGGPGISGDDIEKVTQRFFRGRTKSAIGSGLGLAIVETALRKDGLSLVLENRSPGPGLRAAIIFPADRVTITSDDAAPSPTTNEFERSVAVAPALRG